MLKKDINGELEERREISFFSTPKSFGNKSTCKNLVFQDKENEMVK